MSYSRHYQGKNPCKGRAQWINEGLASSHGLMHPVGKITCIESCIHEGKEQRSYLLLLGKTNEEENHRASEENALEKRLHQFFYLLNRYMKEDEELTCPNGGICIEGPDYRIVYYLEAYRTDCHWRVTWDGDKVKVHKLNRWTATIALRAYNSRFGSRSARTKDIYIQANDESLRREIPNAADRLVYISAKERGEQLPEHIINSMYCSPYEVPAPKEQHFAMWEQERIATDSNPPWARWWMIDPELHKQSLITGDTKMFAGRAPEGIIYTGYAMFIDNISGEDNTLSPIEKANRILHYFETHLLPKERLSVKDGGLLLKGPTYWMHIYLEVLDYYKPRRVYFKCENCFDRDVTIVPYEQEITETDSTPILLHKLREFDPSLYSLRRDEIDIAMCDVTNERMWPNGLERFVRLCELKIREIEGEVVPATSKAGSEAGKTVDAGSETSGHERPAQTRITRALIVLTNIALAVALILWRTDFVPGTGRGIEKNVFTWAFLYTMGWGGAYAPICLLDLFWPAYARKIRNPGEPTEAEREQVFGDYLAGTLAWFVTGGVGLFLYILGYIDHV